MVRLASLLFAATASASAVLNLIPSNFDEIVFQSGKPALVEFFAPWYDSYPCLRLPAYT